MRLESSAVVVDGRECWDVLSLSDFECFWFGYTSNDTVDLNLVSLEAFVTRLVIGDVSYLETEPTAALVDMMFERRGTCMTRKYCEFH